LEGFERERWKENRVENRRETEERRKVKEI